MYVKKLWSVTSQNHMAFAVCCNKNIFTVKQSLISIHIYLKVLILLKASMLYLCEHVENITKPF